MESLPNNCHTTSALQTAARSALSWHLRSLSIESSPTVQRGEEDCATLPSLKCLLLHFPIDRPTIDAVVCVYIRHQSHWPLHLPRQRLIEALTDELATLSSDRSTDATREAGPGGGRRRRRPAVAGAQEAVPVLRPVSASCLARIVASLCFDWPRPREC